ncbi:MAG: phosphatidylcholine/phosphatidylserine synthase [Pseudomonadota bacterium]
MNAARREQLEREEFDRAERARAWAVHAFTASGAVLGFLALVALIEGDLQIAFLWLGLALAVDGIDGTLARKARVREVIPQVDGDTLDNVIDYFTYVVIPAMAIYWYGFVPEGWAMITAALVCGVSCYTFANSGMKSQDYYFVGFPALWNLVVLVFFIIGSDPWVNLAVIGTCAVLTFVPLKYVHPIRVKYFRRFSIPVTALWAATTLGLVLVGKDGAVPRDEAPGTFWVWAAASLYFVALSLWRSVVGPVEDD